MLWKAQLSNIIILPKNVPHSNIEFTLCERWYGAGCTAAVVELQFNAALNPDAESTATVPVYSAIVEFIRKQDWVDGKLLCRDRRV